MPANVNVNVNLVPNTKQVDLAFDSISKRASSVKFGQPLGRISGDVTEFRKSLEAATARVTAFGLTAGAIYKVSEAIRAGARATIEIDKQLVELNTFLGQSRDQLEGFSQSLFKVARNAAVPFEAASEAAKEFARQGLSANEVLRRTEDALTLARISGISYADAVNGVTTAINSFNKEALSSTDIVNKLIAVDTRFAVSSAQLNEALTRVGSSAEESGISIDKLIATVTAAQQITGRGGAVIGNALKTIFTRLQRPEVLSQLEQLGVAIKDQNGFLLDGLSVLKNYADATKNLSQIEKSRTAELIGGIYQINQVNALIKDLSSSNSVYASALKISSAATDEAKKKNEELNKSLSALLQQTKNQAQEAAAALGKPLLEPIVRIGSSFSEILLKAVNPTSDLLGKSEESGKSVGESFFKGAASALGKTIATGSIPLLIGIGGTLLAKMVKFGVSSIKDVSKNFDEVFAGEKSLASQKAVNDVLSQSPKLVALVQKGTISLAAAEQAVLQTLREQNKQLKAQEALRARIIPTVIAKGGPSRVRASGYLPMFGGAQEEVAMAKAYGAKNPKAKLIQATIKGKTQPVMVNSEEDIIPNFAGTGDTAIIPKYRKMQDIPRMSSGYIPNFANEDREILRSIININRLNMASDRFADPRKYKMKTPLYRGVQATSERWRSIDRNDPEAVRKAVFSQVDYANLIPGYSPKKAFMGSYFEDLMSSHRITPLSGRDVWDEMYRNTRQFGYSRSLPIVSTSKDPSIAYQFSGNAGASSSIVMKNSRILGNESLYKGLYAKYGEDKVREVMFRQSKAGGGRGLGIDFNSLSKSNAFNYEHEVGLFSSGYVPNFAKIVAAAYKTKKGNIFTAPWHAAAYEKIPQDENSDLLDGFVTDSGKFVDRKEAGLIAQAAQQLYQNENTKKYFRSNNNKLDTAFLSLPQDKYYSSGYIPNFAKKDKYKFPNISSAKMEANIARNFEKLSPENQKYFARAYEDYNNLIKVFSKASGTSPEKFANVMSALSPANPLERNALDALRYNLFAKKKLSTIASPIFLDEREIGSVKAQTYGANRTKAANLIVGLEKLTGNKRKAFLNNMLDPFGSPDVTVDYRAQGDALNKKFNVKNAPTMNREQYDKVSQAFRNVGSRAGVSGLGVQAATWIGGRMNSKAARGQDFNRGILKFFYDNPDKISLENLEFLLNVPGKGKERASFFKKASAMGVSKLGSDSLISISRAGGYIPNFAGLSDAISREKTMSGLPASQIMAHFDKSGNPIAVTNKKDEPNGLKDVVPNFAKIPTALLSRFFGKSGGKLANPISGALELFEKQAYASIIDELAEREVIPSAVSKFISQALPASAGIKNIGTAILSKKASTGSRVAAGLTGLAQIYGGVKLGELSGGDLDQRIQSRKFEDALDRSKKAFTDLAENTTELSASLSKLDAAYKDPKADPKEIVKLVKTREDLIKKITIKNPELVSRLAGQTSITDQITVLEENLKKAQTQEAIRTSALEFGRKGKITGEQAPAELSSFFNEIINRANTDIFKTDLSQATTANFGEILKKAGLDVKEFSDQLNSDQLKKAFIEALKVAQGIEKISANQAKEIARISKPLASRRQAVEDARDIRSEIKKALEQQLPELAELAGTFSRRAGISASSEASLAIKKADAAVSFQNSLLTQLNDKEFLANLSPAVEARLRNIEAPGAGAARELESLQKLPGLSEAQAKGIQKLIDFNSQQTRDIGKATIIAEESKKIQLKFLALQEKIAFGGDIRASINPQMRAEAMASSLRGPLTYQLGSMIGSRRGQIAGATDFLTDTLQKYPGLLTTKGGKEPADIQAVKGELTRLNAFDMQRDLMRRAGMAQMMGLGQTAGLLRGKAFDQSYLLESAGLKTSALFGSPEIPKDIQKAMGDLEKFNVESVRQAKTEDAALRVLENTISPIKEKLIEVSESQSKALITAFENGLKSTFGTTGIKTTLANITADEVKLSEASNESKVKAAASAYAGMGGLMPTGIPSNANGLTKYSSSITDAVNREKTALASRGIMGVPNFAMANINLERSPDLVTQSNPFGFAVTNSIDEKNGLRSLGMRSSGFVPNYALYGEKVASTGLSAAKAGNLFVYDHGAEGFYKVTPSGKIGSQLIDKESLPKGAKTISTQPYSTKTLSSQLRGSNILKITDPRINKLDELKISTIPKSQRLDPVLRKLSRANKLTPENLLAEINKISGGNQTLVKTAFGSSFAQGQGVFGRGGGIGLGDTEEIIKRFKSGDARGFFTQAAVEGPHYGEMRVHVAVDANGKVKLLKGGSVLKIGAGTADITSKEGLSALSKSGLGKEAGKVAQDYKKAAQATAVKSIRELVAKKGIKNAFFGVDVGATTLESAKKAGVNTKEFYSGGRGRVGTVVFELNPSESLGSSGYMRGSTTQKLVDQVLGNQVRTMPEGFAAKGVSASKRAADISSALLFKESGVSAVTKPAARARDALGRFTSNSGFSKNALKFLGKYGGKALGALGVGAAGFEIAEGVNQIVNQDEKLIGAGNISSGIGSLSLLGAGMAGAGLATTLALPVAVAALGYGAVKGVEATGLLDAMYGAGYKTMGLSAVSSKRVRGLTSREAVEENRIVPRKMELLREINRYNEVAGNPLVSETFQLSRSRQAQINKNIQDAQQQEDAVEKQKQAAKAAMQSRISQKVAEQNALMSKETEAADAAQSSKLRKSFLESFDKNAESAGYLTTQDKVNYLLSQEGKNGLGSFKPTDFKDAEFARSFNAYKAAREAQAAREANQVIPASTIEFRNRPIPSFPQDVLEEAVRTGRSAEKVIADREEAALRRGAASQGMTTPEINTQMSREYTSATGLQDFPKDVLEEAVRRRVTAEQVMQERASGIVPNFAAMSNSMMASGDVYSRMRMSAPRMSFPSAAQGSVPNFAIGEFSDAITEAMRNGITSAFPNGPSSSNVSNSNVINIDGRTSIQNAPDEAMQGIISILFDKIPELKKLGPAALNFKR